MIATTAPELGSRGLTAFWVPLDAPGVTVKPLQAIAPHPIGALELRGVVVPAAARIGEIGQGMKLAMQTLDAFRVSVGAAAVGMARRALDEAIGFVTRRSQFGKLAEPSSRSCRRTSPTWRSISTRRVCSCCARRTPRIPKLAR